MTVPPIESRLVHELKLGAAQVAGAVALLDEGNTIPFITRYRKEATGGLDEEQLRMLAERLQYLRNLEARRAEVHKLLEEGGQRTEELATPFMDAEKGVADVDAAYAGARDIVAETVAETAAVRQALREATR